MTTILIKDSYALYRDGMQKFLSDLFLNNYCENVNFLFEFNIENIQKADIIMMEYCKGEALICTPELMSRKRSVIIGITNENYHAKSIFPNCISDIVFIERGGDLAEISQQIIMQWESFKMGRRIDCYRSCSTCQRVKISKKQLAVMSNIHHGHSIKEIASLYDLSYKTIFSNKYNVMKKFMLQSDYELLVFLNRLSERDLLLRPGLVPGCNL